MTAPALLVENATLVWPGGRPAVRTGHSILIEDGRIARIEPKARFRSFPGRRLNAAGKVVTPGLINAHNHFYSSFARGLTKARPSADFMGVLRNLWWKLDSALTLEDCHASALVAMIEGIRHGTTTVIDHHASPGAVEGSLDAVAKAVKEAGVRACLCYEVSDRDGPKVSQAGLRENERFVRSCLNNPDEHLAALFGLHASFTLSDGTLEKAAGMGRDLGTGFHIHVAEARGDQEVARRRSQMRVVERLKEFHILGPRSIVAHCIYVNEKEIGLLAESRTAVVHNPQSNLNNAVGIADVTEMASREVLIGLGTDAMTTAMLEEARVALWAQHLSNANPSVGFREVTAALFAGNAEIAGRAFGLRLGELKEGAAADLAIFDYDPITPLTDENALGHALFGLSQARVDSTIVAGRVLMEGGLLQLGLDEERLTARARELAKNLWKRM